MVIERIAPVAAYAVVKACSIGIKSKVTSIENAIWGIRFTLQLDAGKKAKI